MPDKYVVLNDGTLVIERWQGEISHLELFEHEMKQLNDASITRDAIALADTRQATFPETTPEMISELVKLHTHPDNKTHISKYALLVKDETWDQAKALEDGAKDHNVTIITFMSLDVACTWLGIDTDETARHLESLEF